MGFSLRKYAERAFAQANPFDKGKTAATVAKAQARQAPPARTPPQNEQRRPAPAVQSKSVGGLVGAGFGVLADKRTWDQVNMFDNNRTWVNPVPTANMSVKQQANKLVVDNIVKPIAKSANTLAGAGIQGAQGTADLARLGVESVRGTDQSYNKLLNQATQRSNQNIPFSGKGGLMGAGTDFTNARELNDPKKLASTALTTGSNISSVVAPSMSLKAGFQQGGKVLATKLVGANIVDNAVNSAASQYSQTGQVDLKPVALSAGIGAAVPVAGYAGGRVAKGALNASKVPATKLVNKVVETPELSPQQLGQRNELVAQRSVAELRKPDVVPMYDKQINAIDATTKPRLRNPLKPLNEAGYAKIPGKPTGNKAVRQTENIPQNPMTPQLDPNAVPRQGLPLQSQIQQPKEGLGVSPVSRNVEPTNTKLPQVQSKVESLQGSTSLQQRGFIQTVLDDPNTSPEVRDSISSLYSTRNTKEAQIKASNLVKQDRDVAERIAANPVDDTGVFVGNELVKQLQKEGNYQRAIEIVQKQAEALTASGRMSQAASTYGKLTPQGVIRFAQNELENYNKLNNVRTEKRLKLTPEQSKSLTDKAEAIQKMPEGRDKDIATKQMMKEVYELVPVTWVKKVSTLQTIAQLLNPKTTVRNVLGNTIFGTTDTISQTVASGLDKGVSKVLGTERTTSLPNLKTMAKGGLRGGKEAYQETKLGINLGAQTQFDLNDVPALRSKFFGGLEKTMGITLRVPDRTAYQATFDDTVRGLMKANKLDKPTEGILEQAHANAMYRTFQDNSNAAQLFVGLKKALNKVGVEKDGNTWGLGDLILKYPKTPGNILARGIDYSPLGILKGLKAVTDATFAGKPFDQYTFVNSVSRSAVGTTGLVGTGAVLGALGIITEKPSPDTDTRNLQKQTGLGGYQINTSALRRFIASGFDKDSTKIQKGDSLVTYDWAQPLSIPLSAGAAMGKGQSAKDGAMSTLSGAAEGVNTLVEQPLVTGVNTFATNIKNKGVTGALMETAKGAPASFIPTASNQARQLSDNTSRNTYDPNAWKESLNKVVNRVPGADRILNPQVDTLGANKQNFQDGGNNIFNVLFNPSFSSKYKPTGAAELPLNIYNQTGDTQQMPRTAKDKIRINGKTVTLTADQLEEYQRFTGVKTREAYTALSKDAKFNSLSDADKANVMSKQLTDINAAAKVKLFGGTGNASDKTMDILNGKVVTANIKKKGEKSSTSKPSEKDYYKVKDAEYKDFVNKYNKDKAEGKITALQDIDKQKKLTKLQIGAKYDKEARDLWGKSKATVFQYISSLPQDKAQSLTQQLTAYDQDLYNAGVAKYATFKNGIAPKGRGGKRGGGKRSGGRKSGGRRTARGGRKGGGRARGTTKNGEEKARLKDYKLSSLVSARSNQDRKLRQIVKAAELSNRSKGSAKGTKVATRKYTPKKGTIKKGNSVG